MTTPCIVLIGAVNSTRIALEVLIEARCTPKLLITLPVNCAGMHSDFVDLASLAEQSGSPLLRTLDVNRSEIVEQVARLNPDFIFVIGWSRLVGRALRSCAKMGTLGYHPTALPKGRGRSALAWTILLGMRETAGSLFWIDEGVDSGQIAAQIRFALSPRVDLPELYAQHMHVLRRMLSDLLPDLRAGRIPAHDQDESAATYFALRRPEDGWIDWSANANTVDRLVRALAPPYPGAFTTWCGHRMTIGRGEPVEMPEWHAQVGQVFLIDGRALYVRCGSDSSYRIDEYEILAEPGEAVLSVKGQPLLGLAKDLFHA